MNSFGKNESNIKSLAIGINNGAAPILPYSYKKYNQDYKNEFLAQVYPLDWEDW